VAAVLATDHPLARRRMVRWADLAGETLLCLPRGTGVRAAVDLSRAAAGAEPRVDLEASSPATLIGLAGRGAGVALLTESMTIRAAGVVAKVVSDASVTARLGLVVRDGQLPSATRVLLDRLRTALTG
jgi:DNA-binding transcriptional LysR family regulator